MSDKIVLPRTHWISLGIGIAIGCGFLFVLIALWPLLLLAGAGYCIYKGLPPSLKIGGTKGTE